MRDSQSVTELTVPGYYLILYRYSLFSLLSYSPILLLPLLFSLLSYSPILLFPLLPLSYLILQYYYFLSSSLSYLILQYYYFLSSSLSYLILLLSSSLPLLVVLRNQRNQDPLLLYFIKCEKEELLLTVTHTWVS